MKDKKTKTNIENKNSMKKTREKEKDSMKKKETNNTIKIDIDKKVGKMTEKRILKDMRIRLFLKGLEIEIEIVDRNSIKDIENTLIDIIAEGKEKTIGTTTIITIDTNKRIMKRNFQMRQRFRK
jgi:hypothetical protein